MTETPAPAPAPTRTLDVVVPLFNEAEGIATFHEALVGVLDTLEPRYTSSVIYVVDPSPDGTAERVREIADKDGRVRAVLLLRRAGHQMSIIAGLKESDADVVIMMDGDLQHPPELIPRMLDLHEGGMEIVQTVRARTEGQSRIARAMSQGFYRLMGRLSEVPMVPGGADYRLISARVARILSDEIVESDRFLRGLIPWLGLPTATVEFVAPQREAGRSKYTLRRSISFAVNGIVSFSKVPLQIGIVLGLIVSLIGVVSGVGAAVMWFAGADIPAGWTTLVVMLAVLSGMQLVSLGLVGLYLGVVFDEAKKRPQILVAEVVAGRGASTGALTPPDAATPGA
jgi:dolichol-phosphate mannosyltransferase